MTLPKFHKTFRVASVTGRTSNTMIRVLVNGRPVECSLHLLEMLSPEFVTECRGTPSIFVEEEVAAEMTTLMSIGQVDVNAENLERLTFVANQLDLSGLREFCERVYLNHLSPSRCLQFWILAMDNGLEILKRKALDLVRENFDAISRDESFRYIGKFHVEMLILDPHIRKRGMEHIREVVNYWSGYGSEEDLRAPAKEELISAYTRNISETQEYDNYSFSLDNESVSNYDARMPSGQNYSRNRRVSESQDLDKLWITKSESKKLFACKMCLENGNILPIQQSVSFPTEMEDVSAFWHCSRRNCMYASNEKDFWKLDDGCRKWRKCRNVPSGRRHHMMCQVGDKLYALGGYDSQTLKLTQYVLEYDMKKDSWTNFRHVGKIYEMVQSGKCATIDKDIYIFGGYHGNNQNDLVKTVTAQKYNVATKSSERLANLPFTPPTHEFVSCVVSDSNFVYIFSSNGELALYQPDTNTYQLLPSYPSPRKRFAAFISDDVLYIFGGQRKSDPVREIYYMDLREQYLNWKICGMLDMPLEILSNS